jgi:hypothetical protein
MMTQPRQLRLIWENLVMFVWLAPNIYVTIEDKQHTERSADQTEDL